MNVGACLVLQSVNVGGEVDALGDVEPADGAQCRRCVAERDDAQSAVVGHDRNDDSNAVTYHIFNIDNHTQFKKFVLLCILLQFLKIISVE